MMEECRIIDYTEKWRDKLREYLHKVFPDYSDQYIEYCLDRSAERIPSLIVINEYGEIVGCHLYFCTQVMVEGEILETQWGHDTYLDKEYRARIGLDLMLATHTKKGFGIGLSKVNEKLQRLLKEVFFKGAYNYYLVTWKIVLSPFQKLFGTNLSLKHPERLKVGKHLFMRVKDANELDIPNAGFWFKGQRDIDFIRDSNFLNERFLKNMVHQYYMYVLDTIDGSCYFVVRKTHYRGMPAITLSDYRYTKPSMAGIILRAVDKLAFKSNIGIIVFLSGDDYLEKCIRGRIHHKTKEDFVTNLKVKSTLTYSVTGGDADADFLK